SDQCDCIGGRYLLGTSPKRSRRRLDSIGESELRTGLSTLLPLRISPLQHHCAIASAPAIARQLQRHNGWNGSYSRRSRYRSHGALHCAPHTDCRSETTYLRWVLLLSGGIVAPGSPQSQRRLRGLRAGPHASRIWARVSDCPQFRRLPILIFLWRRIIRLAASRICFATRVVVLASHSPTPYWRNAHSFIRVSLHSI